jgi:hypothetical protein
LILSRKATKNPRRTNGIILVLSLWIIIVGMMRVGTEVVILSLIRLLL